MINESVRRSFLRSRQVAADDAESGGMLLGHIYELTDSFGVEEATLPSPEDKRTRFSIFRKQIPAQRCVDKAWNKSGGILNYLGEWHTHPETFPTPSYTDISNWKQIVKKATFDQEVLFFLIVGFHAFRAWEVNKHSGSIVELTISNEGD